MKLKEGNESVEDNSEAQLMVPNEIRKRFETKMSHDVGNPKN